MKMTCDCCGEYFYDEDLYTLDDGSQVCEECYNNEVHTCCNCGATFLDEPEYDEEIDDYNYDGVDSSWFKEETYDVISRSDIFENVQFKIGAGYNG